MTTAGSIPSDVDALDAAMSTPRCGDRALRAYRKRIARCRTPNQVNRIHIALDNYMTPAEVRYFRAALDGEPAESPSRQWISRLAGAMPTNIVRPIEFERRGLVKGVTHYTAAGISPDRKTLIIAFTGALHRLMLPTPWLLDCFNPALYDVVLLRDFSRVAYASGIPGLGGDFATALAGLRSLVDPGAYRNAISIGTSAGGLPAMLAAIGLELDKAIAIGPQTFERVAALLKTHGLSDEPYSTLLASRPQSFPDVLLVCAAQHDDDVAAAASLQQRVPSRVVKVKNCPVHGVLGWHHAQGSLPAFLAKLLDQSLEEYPMAPSMLAATWTVGAARAPSPHPTVAGAVDDPKVDSGPAS